MLTRAPFDIAKRVLMWFVSGLTILSGYALAKLEPFAEARLLPLTELDAAIPLVPWTIWIYGSGTLTCLVAWLCVPDRLAARRLYFSLLMAALGCWMFFFLVPTTYPRELWPLPPGDSATLREFADLRAADSPSNCFPSQHVALAWALALCWASWTRHRWFRPIPLVWAAAVTVCTLTVKQHYLVDLPAGFAIGVLSWAAVRHGITPRARVPSLALTDPRARAVAEGLLGKVRAHTWSLDAIDWPTGPLPPLPPEMARLLNQTVYIEEIAGLNFRLLRDASVDPVLRELYDRFSDEERRHAEGLRRILALHGHPLTPPGLGTALVLDQFDTLDPTDPADVALVAVSTPVFETFLDAGTIPFLKAHPRLASPAFDAFVARVDADEGAHLALNWLVTREIAREYTGLRGLKLALEPNVYRGMLAVPWMSLDTYTPAHALGFDFRSLLPAFERLWRLHERHPELAGFALWGWYRVFVASGVIATVVADRLARAGWIVIRFWLGVTRVTDLVARGLFGAALLDRRGIPGGLAPAPAAGYLAATR